MAEHNRLGKVGIWSSAWTNAYRAQRTSACGELDDAAAELEFCGYGALWLGGSPPLAYARNVLVATSGITVATGILSIWEHEATDVAAERAALERDHPGRFLLGLGVSHPHLTARYAHPYAAMQAYLSALDAAPEPVPPDARVLAALGPKMLALSRDRAAGAHPYLVTVEHTAYAREILGDQALLAPELKVVLEPDLDVARGTARSFLVRYLEMPNYTNNLLRFGFSEHDFADGGSDRLLDAVFALGNVDAIAGKVEAFHEAGADHVAIQVVTDEPRTALPRAAWRTLAGALPLNGIGMPVGGE
jgi:probable F420-dependent oxidoreductase